MQAHYFSCVIHVIHTKKFILFFQIFKFFVLHMVIHKIRNSVFTERKFPSGKIYLKSGTEVIPKIRKEMMQNTEISVWKIFFLKKQFPVYLNMEFHDLKYGNSLNFNYSIILIQKNCFYYRFLQWFTIIFNSCRHI